MKALLGVNHRHSVDIVSRLIKLSIYCLVPIVLNSGIVSTAMAERPGEKVVEVQNGLWVEVRDFDPVKSNRQVRHIWLHHGALVFDVERVKPGSPYRYGITYFGLPIRFLINKQEGGYHVREVRQSKAKRQAFHLARNVFCPGESSEFVRTKKCVSGLAPIGEGYIFDFKTVDSDKDGEPDKKGGLDYYEVSILLDTATARKLGMDTHFKFDLYRKELEQFEKEGILFRLDRTHPQHEIRFLGSTFQSCGSTKSTTIEKTTAIETYVKAEGKSEVGFWNWLKAEFTIGASASMGANDKDSIQVSSTTAGGTTFRQWGIIIDHSAKSTDPNYETAFYIKKIIECNSSQGEVRFGDRIKSVEIGIQNKFLESTDATEFSRSTDLQQLDSKFFDIVDKPIFISVNTSEDQAYILDVIREKLAREEQHLVALVFSQLNLACPEKRREQCLAWSKWINQ